MPIKFLGLDDFSEEEISTLKELVGHHYKKIKHHDISKFELIVHAKKHFKGGKPDKAIKYSLVTRMEAPRFLLAAEAADWNLRKVCHEVMVKLESEFSHKFKSDTSYSKPYYK